MGMQEPPPDMHGHPLQFAPPPPTVPGGYATLQQEGAARTLSAYNLFVRAMTLKFRAEMPDLAQGDLMKKVGDMWRGMLLDEQNRWRVDGDLGSTVPGATTFISTPKAASKPSAYQAFVRQMSANLKAEIPGSKQADNMKRIGEMWRQMQPDERARYEPGGPANPGGGAGQGGQ
eukprot:CAMPEP_0180215376 /NCGR_PEP_ID=MMETSP0987-20121128/15477_1 /TAXON_ID=697907 /ORGANISM="non described non described, Strain CCMP2293" /LENGTH=173 /DNA_ID=CAMNT_0022174059 /DNA_START=152 /DNA_END=670 /DNA_ORIENTATION=-